MKRRSRSSGVNLPSLPSLSALGFLGLDEDFDCAEGCEEVEAVLSVLLLLAGVEGFVLSERLAFSERVETVPETVPEAARLSRLASD